MKIACFLAVVVSGIPLRICAHLSRPKIRDFQPLSCNNNLAATVCKSWSKLFGPRPSFDSRVVIPCGSCVHLDTPRESIVLRGGLDIQGKLVIDDEVTVRASAIIVQGELVVDTRSVKRYLDGNPVVRFVMTEEPEVSPTRRAPRFTPIGENQNACYGVDFCLAGMKSITVAGGKVSIHGIPNDTPTWVKLYDVANEEGLYVSSLVVSGAVKSTWGRGAEILITSHTRDWNSHQVRTIVEVVPYTQRPGDWMELRLNEPVIRPTTMRNDRDFAVEVALLSRNILFDAEMATNDPLRGGHFWIFHTPLVPQVLEGVEIRNFGQQGVLGRYPIHVHVCGNMAGSMVSKNVIRSSHQRCVVVHATDNLKVTDNIAFDTKGHCFMLEDGIETGNVFSHNLGAMTAVPQILIPDSALNGHETDFMPSTFWITNPTNEWIGNVAAGSQGSGFWLEPTKRGLYVDEHPNIDPKADPLTLFKGNEAHSNADKGFRSYPSGYMPGTQQTISGFKSYRNDGTGIFLHNTRNIRLLRGRVADNKHIGIDIDKAGAIVVEDVKVIGLSSSFESVLASQDVSSPCRTGRLHGIELHTWQAERLEGQVEISGVAFRGYNVSFCPDSTPIHFEGDTKTGQFDAFAKVHGVTYESQMSSVDMCSAFGEEVDNIYLTDLDSGLQPPYVQATGTSTLLGSGSLTLDLLKQSSCVEKTSGCVTYCPNVCLRTIQFEIDPSGTERYTVQACKTSSPRVCVAAPGFRWADRSDLLSSEPRSFNLQLTAGDDFRVSIRDQSGSIAFPQFIRKMEADSPCDSLGGEVQIITPPLDDVSCVQLVRNGLPERDDGLFWLHRFGGLTVEHSRDGAALAGVSLSPLATIVQYLDIRCVKKYIGKYYEMQADIKLENPNGAAWFCDSDQRRCPVVGLFNEASGFHPVATVDPVVITNGFQRAAGFIKIDSTIASADEVRIYVRSGVAQKRMLTKNVSMRLIENPDRFCYNLISWPYIEPSHLWDVVGEGTLSSLLVESDLDGSTLAPAIRFTRRVSFYDTLLYGGWTAIDTRCVIPGSKWRLVTRLRLEDRKTSESVACALDSCPEVKFSLRDSSGIRLFVEKSSSSCWEIEEWNTCKMLVTLPLDWDGTIQRMVFEISKFIPQYDLTLMGAYMKPVN